MCFFFFKQKTAYEMRISDWSSDVCSSDLPHKIAVDAGIVIRCGLFGVSTHHKSLPDAVLANYLQYCQEYWAYGGSKTLRFAQLVVAAAPDFSWGWSAVGNGFMQVAQVEPDRSEERRGGKECGSTCRSRRSPYH